MLYQVNNIMKLPLESEMRVEEMLVIPTTLIVSITAYCTNYNECIHKKDETSETIVQNFFSVFLHSRNSL